MFKIISPILFVLFLFLYFDINVKSDIINNSDITITSSPPKVVHSSFATFEFSSGITSSTFECRLDNGNWSRCSSPKALIELTDGEHDFEIRSVDNNGNISLIPFNYKWIVSIPPTFIGLKSALADSNNSIILQWESATDETTSKSNIIYLICESQTQGECLTSFKTKYKSPSGATSFKVEGLLPMNKYYYVVRSMDESGNTDSNLFEKLAGTFTASSISVGDNHTCLVTTNSKVLCWGKNSYGQLGDGTIIDRDSPVEVIGIKDEIKSISVSDNHTCALTKKGSVKCWGSNYYGNLGVGTRGSFGEENYFKPYPVDVIGLKSDVIALSSGGNHSCAIIKNKGVKCWGLNSDGLLGDNTNKNRADTGGPDPYSSIPINVSGLKNDESIAITSGYEHTCVLSKYGSVKCWGGNFNGQMGNGTRKNNMIAKNVLGLEGGVVYISAGRTRTCALLQIGVIKCWGGIPESIPAIVPNLKDKVIELSVGGDITCIINDSGLIKCWTENRRRDPFDNILNISFINIEEGLKRKYSFISINGSNQCYISNSGGVYCWGYKYLRCYKDSNLLRNPDCSRIVTFVP
jgi:alpha-tubulin suppressor-like RCC1 family protein